MMSKTVTGVSTYKKGRKLNKFGQISFLSLSYLFKINMVCHALGGQAS